MSDTEAPDSPARSRLGPVHSGSLHLYNSKYGSFIQRPPHDAAMRQLLKIANRLADMSSPQLTSESATDVEALRQQMADFYDAQQVFAVIDALLGET